tara:strand:+ start:12146 stop:12406 length:261 start_codon:yes stop_codon:yes gene_type:complete
MKIIIILILAVKVAFFLLYLISRNREATQEDNAPRADREIDLDTLSNKLVNASRLEKCKSEYPFARWRLNATEHAMEQYSLAIAKR